MRAAAKGLDIVIVNPTFVLGPDDPTRTSMGLVRRFCLGQIPAYVAGALNVVDVRDVATGHLLADEKGVRAPSATSSPAATSPSTASSPTSPGSAASIRRRSSCRCGSRSPAPRPHRAFGLRLAGSPEEVRSASLWWTYRNTKAKRELGFAPRPHEQTLEDAVEWQLAELGGRRGGGRRQRDPLAAGWRKALRR